MNTKRLPFFLSPIRVNLADLLLDPNNPRFSELGEELNPIPEGRFADEKVQANTFEKMKHQSFDVAELRDTIKALGFLPMDRIVVRRWKGKSTDANERYVVIEGNRRVSALKWLVSLHDIGKETFDDEQIANFTKLECLLLNDEAAPESATLILPGLRHVSGVKEWGAYQKAKAVYALRRNGLSPQETAQSLGLSTRSANSSYRCFLALEQMKGDEEFGEFAEPRMYSFFEEILKRPVLKNWFGWSDEKEHFTSEGRIREFYSWITPQGDDGGNVKLNEAIGVRELATIVEDENALNILRAPEGTLTKALARYEIDHPEDWLPKVGAAMAALKSLTPDAIRGMGESAVEELSSLVDRVKQVLQDKKLLTGKS